MNTVGSYKCVCQRGFKIADDGRNCMIREYSFRRKRIDSEEGTFILSSTSYDIDLHCYLISIGDTEMFPESSLHL